MKPQLPSELILEQLREQAQQSSRPDVRLASIQRLVEACDALASGAVAEVYRAVHGVDGGLGRNAKINPSNVEKYVKARLEQGAKDWTGPTRVFIASDPDLSAYVAAREDERSKPARPRARASQRQKDIEDAISRLHSVEMRQLLRHDIEEGRLSKRRLELLSRGLRTLPGIDVDALLRGDQTGGVGPAMLIPASEASGGPPLTAAEIRSIKTFMDRISDTDEMRRAGLELDGSRLRLASPPRTTIIRPDEMEVLRRLAGRRS